MQPLYARTYGAVETENRDVVEKYMMNMLPEEVNLIFFINQKLFITSYLSI